MRVRQLRLEEQLEVRVQVDLLVAQLDQPVLAWQWVVWRWSDDLLLRTFAMKSELYAVLSFSLSDLRRPAVRAIIYSCTTLNKRNFSCVESCQRKQRVSPTSF